MDSKKNIALIVFHSEIYKVYKREWINECLFSLHNQTFKNFKVYEICYGHETNLRLWNDSIDFQSKFYYLPMPNHVFAENIAIDLAYNDEVDYFFIVNLDDIYVPDRVEKQLKFLDEGYDLVSSDFIRFWEEGKIMQLKMHKLDFAKEANENHNIVAHPVVAFNRNFWEKCRYFDVNGIPQEDFDMWKRAYSKGMKIGIVPKILLFHRIHSNNVGRIE